MSKRKVELNEALLSSVEVSPTGRMSDDNGLELLSSNGYVFDAHNPPKDPPFLQRNMSSIICTLLYGAVVAICLTVLKDPLYDLDKDVFVFKRLAYGATIPVISVLFTYGHIWLALHMTFYPLEFVGIWRPKFSHPYGLGWQGIIPSKAAKMAEMSVDLMTTKLLKMDEVFNRLDPARVAQEMEPAINDMLPKILEEVGKRLAPTTWKMLPDAVKAELLIKAKEDAPSVVANMMTETRENIMEVFDLKDMVVSALMADKDLLNQMFITCGKKELRFIKILGGYFGFLFGAIQMSIWFFYEAKWVLPVTGFLVGYSTNWLALKMIFEPVEPKILCGMKLHGLFLQRQREVAAVYGKLVTENVLSTKSILRALLNGKTSDKLFSIVTFHVKNSIDAFGGDDAAVFLKMQVGDEKYNEIKQEVCDMVVRSMPEAMEHIVAYADEALDLERTLREKMGLLSSSEFERLLHPVFEEDESKLIVIGGLLGVTVGLIQSYLLEPFVTKHLF